MLALLGVLVVASVAVHVEDVGDVPPELRADIVAALSRAVEVRAQSSVVVDEDRSGCLAGQPCAAAIRSRTTALDVLLVRLIGGPLRVRVVLDHLDDRGASRQRTEGDLPRDGGDVATLARTLVEATFDARPSGDPAPAALLDQAAPEPGGPPWVAVALLGTGAVSAAVGVGFGLSSRGALDELRGGGTTDDDIVRLGGRASTHGTVANVLFVVAVAAVAAGATAWLADGP